MGFLKKLFGSSPKPGKPQDISDALFPEMVLNAETPAVVDFWSITCAPCRIMGSLLEEISPQYEGKINVFKMNLDYHRQAAQKYDIRSVPTVIFFKNGKEIDRVVGLLQLHPLQKKFDNLLK